MNSELGITLGTEKWGVGEHRKGMHQCMYVCMHVRTEKGPYPAIQGQQDGVTLDVPVDDALSMQISQRLQHSLAHSGDLLFTQPAGEEEGPRRRV